MFPFKLEDLESWTVRRTDGTVAKFILTEAVREESRQKRKGVEIYPSGIVEKAVDTYKRVTGHLSSYCNHVPKNPIFEIDASERGEGALATPLRLYVGDVYGAKLEKDNFDFVIDGGDVISLYASKSTKILDGDPELVSLMRPYTVEIPGVRVLKIDWWDRKAPDVIPEFWVELNNHLYGDVMTCCQGGHGRSGTSAVCLMLVNSPDYSALDAIIHLRAVHCPRAIESEVQHGYIDNVATFLGREADAGKAKEINDYRAAFLASSKPTALRTKKILGW